MEFAGGEVTMNTRQVFPSVIGCIAALSLAPQGVAQDASTRSIDHVAGDLYRAVDNAHRTVFLVTSEGIILADPIGTDFATWLKAELDERFGLPVRYVLYSHYHQDHASGGAVFEDDAQFIGHENMIPNLEAVAGQVAYAEVRAPDITYADRMTVTLGGKTVEMLHALPSHSNDSSIIHFPEERAIFAVDFVNVRRVPFQTMSGAPISAWINANLDMQTRVDYDIAVPAHGRVGTKEDVYDTTRYMVDLREAVAEAVAAGLSLEETQATVLMDDYSDWQQWEVWRPLNVQGVYEQLSE